MLLIFDLKWIFQDIDDQLTERAKLREYFVVYLNIGNGLFTYSLPHILKNRYKIYRQTLAVFEVKLL